MTEYPDAVYEGDDDPPEDTLRERLLAAYQHSKDHDDGRRVPRGDLLR